MYLKTLSLTLSINIDNANTPTMRSEVYKRKEKKVSLSCQ